MYKKINMLIIAFFLILSLNFDIGFSLYIPILLYYLIRDIKNIYYFLPTSTISLVIFTQFNYIIYYLILMVVILLILWIMNKISKGIYIYGFVILLNVFSWVLLYHGFNNIIRFLIMLLISVALYFYLEKNLIASLKYNSSLINSAYTEILIAFITFVSASKIYVFNLNLGFIVGVYFSMYFSASYKNIYASLYGIMTMCIGVFYFGIKEMLFLPFIASIYYLPFVYPLVIANIFSVLIILANTSFVDGYLILIMATSIIFEILKPFVIKTNMTKEVIKDNFYDKTLDKVSNEVLSFAQFLDKFAQSFKTPQEYNEKISDGIKILVQSHCAKCPKQKECFNEYRANIYIFLRYLLLRGEKEPLTFKEFSRNCVKFKELDYTTRKLSEQIDYKTPSRNNNALIGQILGVAGALRKYAVDMVSKSEMDVNSWLEFKNRLQAYGFDISYFNVVKAFEQDYLFEIGIKDYDFDGLKDQVKYIGDMLLPSRASVTYDKTLEHTTYIKVIPEIKLDILYGFGALSSDGNNICGDNYLIKELSNGKFISAISDGMGKGYSAFCESNMTLNLVEDVLALDIDSSTALEILNSFYVIQDYLERYATLDLLEINRYTLNARFYKMGGTTSYIVKKSGLIEPIFNKNLPFGIDDALENYDYKVEDGDLILMSSDGIFENIEVKESLESFIRSIRHNAPQKIAYELINYAMNAHLKVKDDMTLIVLKIKYV